MPTAMTSQKAPVHGINRVTWWRVGLRDLPSLDFVLRLHSFVAQYSLFYR